MTKYPVYIPTKGRATTASAPRLLEQVGFPYTLVVEPQEYETYKENFPMASFLVLPKDDQGLSYSRQCIMEHEYRSGGTWHWQIDDDIKAFYRPKNSSRVKADARVLAEAESLCGAFDDLGQVSLARREWLWFGEKPFLFNTYCCHIVCNHVQRIFPVARYREDVQEDMDMTLQVLCAGYRVARWECFAIGMPECGTNAGGCHEEYTRNENSEWSKKMLEWWGPELIELVQRPEGLDIKVNWKHFSQRTLQKRQREGL